MLNFRMSKRVPENLVSYMTHQTANKSTTGMNLNHWLYTISQLRLLHSSSQARGCPGGGRVPTRRLCQLGSWFSGGWGAAIFERKV
jgi:hypothetical protein